MDKEQARFILSSYRPGGDATDDQNLAQALALAAENRELGEWLAKERAMDEAFASALASIQLPGTLRDDILGCLEGERNDFPNADESCDATMIGALASVKVPDTLRQNILAAMNRSAPAREAMPANNSPASGKIVPFWKKLSMPLAAAAGIAIAFIVTHQPEAGNTLASARLVPIETVPASFIQTFESPSFSLDVKQEHPEQLVEVLKSRALPCPCCLPPGLNGMKSIGCRELTINGKQGSLICFEQNELGIVHLVIFRRGDVDGSCSNQLAEPCYIDKGDWSVARWQNDDSVFFLISKAKVDQLAKLF